MTLCREVFHCSLTELDSRLSVHELAYWIAHYQAGTRQDEREDMLSAVVCHTVANQRLWDSKVQVNKRQLKAIDIKEFMPRKQAKRPDATTLHSKLAGWAKSIQRRAHGKK